MSSQSYFTSDSSHQLTISILDLLADSGDNAAGVTRRIVAKSISEASPHSFFTGVRLHHTGHPSSGEEGEVSQSGVPFTRALLHITPVKDGNVSRSICYEYSKLTNIGQDC